MRVFAIVIKQATALFRFGVGFFVVLLMLGASSVSVRGQENIASEIMKYTPGRSELISRGRSMLLDAFMDDNSAKVEDVFLYLVNDVEDTEYIAFYYAEKVTLACWLGMYDMAVREIACFYNDSTTYPTAIKPPADQLWPKLYEKAQLYREALFQRIESASLSAEDKAVLTLTMESILTSRESVFSQEQEDINKKCNEFLTSYPQSVYGRYVREKLRFQVKPADWGFGMGINAGYSGHTGALADMVSGYATIGFEMEVTYKRFMFGFTGNYGMGADLRGSVQGSNTNEVWSGSASTFNGGLYLGFKSVDARKWALTPFVGVGGCLVEPLEPFQKQHPEFENFDLCGDVSCMFGFNLEGKLSMSKRLPHLLYSYYPVRLRAAYLLNCDSKAFMPGDLFTITLGIGMYIRNSKREM